MLSSTFSEVNDDDTETLGSVGAGESERLRLEGCGCFQLKPLFSREGVNDFLFLSFLTVVLLALSNSHRSNIKIFYKLNKLISFNPPSSHSSRG
jgi:hypothetical protein